LCPFNWIRATSLRVFMGGTRFESGFASEPFGNRLRHPGDGAAEFIARVLQARPKLIGRCDRGAQECNSKRRRIPRIRPFVGTWIRTFTKSGRYTTSSLVKLRPFGLSW